MQFHEKKCDLFDFTSFFLVWTFLKFSGPLCKIIRTWLAATVAVNFILRLPLPLRPSAFTEPKFKVNNSNSCCKVFRVKVLEGVESLGDVEQISSDNSSGCCGGGSTTFSVSSITSSSLVPELEKKWTKHFFGNLVKPQC